MILLQLFTAFVLIYTCLCAAITKVADERNLQDVSRAEDFRGNNYDEATFIPDTKDEETTKSDVISVRHTLDDLLELETDPLGLEPRFKEKRCKNNDYIYDLVGSSRSSLPTLHLTRRDLQSDSLKRRCEICKESTRCKKLGKCELCAQICQRYEAALKAQVLDIKERDVNQNDIVGVASRIAGESGDLETGLSEQEDRYYTVGSFGPGPVHDLLVKLLDIKNKDSIERLVILAKAKTKGFSSKPPHPVVIDTAHVFSLNEGRPKQLDVEVHDVEDKGDSFESLTSKLNQELDRAIDDKKKNEGDPHLTPDEIDKIIEDTVSHINTSNEKPSNVVGITSRNGGIKDENSETVTGKEDYEGKDQNDPFVDGNNNNSTKHADTMGQENKTNNNVEQATKKTMNQEEKPVSNKVYTESNNSSESKESEEKQGESNKVENNIEEEANIKNEKERANYEYQPPMMQNRYLPPNQYDNQNYQPAPNEVNNNEPQQFFHPEPEQINYIHEPMRQPPALYSDNQYSIPKAAYGYENSPKMYAPKQEAQPEEPARFEEERQYSETNEENSPEIFVPGGTVTDDSYVQDNYDVVGNSKIPKSEKRPIDEMDPVLAEKWYENQYKDLKKWVKENVAMAPPEASSPVYQKPSIPNHLVHRVNDIIDGATASAKNLNEKITNLVKSNVAKSDILNQAPNIISDSSEEHIVKLDNMNEFATRFTPKEQLEIMDKTPKDDQSLVASTQNKDPYDKHPRLESRYDNGKWTPEKLAPKEPPYQSKHQVGKNEFVGIEQEATESNNAMTRRPFIDPKLLDMKSIVQDLKRVPDYVFRKAGEIADVVQPKTEKNEDYAQATTQRIIDINTAPIAMLLSRFGNNGTEASKVQENPEETVACSDEEPYYREAEKNTKENHNNEELTKENFVSGTGETEDNLGLARNQEDSMQIKDENTKQIVGAEENNLDLPRSANPNENETVACSDEEDEGGQLIHVQPIKDYDGYRSNIKQELSKLRIPTLDDILHPSEKSSSKTDNKVPHIPSLSDLVHTKHSSKKDSSEDDTSQKSEEKHSDSEKKTTSDASEAHKHNHKSKSKKIEPNSDSSSELNSSEDVPQDVQTQPDQYIPEDDFQQSPVPQNFGFNPQMPDPGHQVPPNMNRFTGGPESLNGDQMENFAPSMDQQERMPLPPPEWQEMDDEMIGSPVVESRFQTPGENYTHLGKIIPAEHQKLLSMHNRDVSDQVKPHSVYFVGDGIKLPLNMKQHDDGSLHLSVDVKKLCKCKHCNNKHAHNKTFIDEERRLTSKLIENNDDIPREEVGATKEAEEGNEDDVPLTMGLPPNLADSEDIIGQPDMRFFGEVQGGQPEVAKRSPRAKNSLIGDNFNRRTDSGEMVAVFDKFMKQNRISDEMFDDVTPIKRYDMGDESEFHGNPSMGERKHGLNLVKRKVGLVTNVLDWMKKLALEEAKLHSKNK